MASGSSDKKASLDESEQPASADVIVTSDLDDDVICDEDKCPVCLDFIKEEKLLRCGHRFCTRCLELWRKPQCPFCREMHGPLLGTMPPGTMCSRTEKWPRLPGYEHAALIIIDYNIPDGIQTEHHPRPGRRFRGTTRTAYLPDTPEGRRVLRLLRRAFDARLTFTVGTSRTTGATDTVTWNDIHHKTSITGGPERFGYPDEDYLFRVQEELATNGITE